MQHSFSLNGLLGLDTMYPYPFPDIPPPPGQLLDDPTYGQPDNDAVGASNDSPSNGLLDTMLNFTANETFYTYMMYLPHDLGCGHMWVPLHRITWVWAANASRTGSTWANNVPTYFGPVSVSEDKRFKLHPIWSRINEGSAPRIP